MRFTMSGLMPRFVAFFLSALIAAVVVTVAIGGLDAAPKGVGIGLIAGVVGGLTFWTLARHRQS